MRTSDILKGDRIIWVVYLLLCMISLIEVFSASATLSYNSGDHHAPITGHCLALGVGLITAYVAHQIPFKYYRLVPHIVYPLSCILLLVVMIMGMVAGERVNGAARWLWGFQPSEMAKWALVTSVAYILGKYQEEKSCSPVAFKPIVWMSAIIFILIAPENGSTALLLGAVVLLLMIVGRIPGIQLAKLTAAIILIGTAFVWTVMSIPASEYRDKPFMHRVETWQNRIKEFVAEDGTVPPSEYNTDKNAQRAHANIAIADSHIFGKGPGNSTQREFLPQAYSDFIYAIIVEELGLIGGAFVVLLYVILLFRAGRIARKCESPFPALLVIGLAMLVVLQAMANMWVATGLLPVTGQPLPLLSKGGSSILFTSLYFGIILNVSRMVQQESEQEEEEHDTQTSPTLNPEETQET